MANSWALVGGGLVGGIVIVATALGGCSGSTEAGSPPATSRAHNVHGLIPPVARAPMPALPPTNQQVIARISADGGGFFTLLRDNGTHMTAHVTPATQYLGADGRLLDRAAIHIGSRIAVSGHPHPMGMTANRIQALFESSASR